MITIIKLRDLVTDLSRKGMAQVFADWQTLVGVDARSSAEAIRLADGAAEIDHLVPSPRLIVEAQVQRSGEDLGPIHFVLPNRLVVEIISGVLMIAESTRDARAAESLGGNDVATFSEMAMLLCRSWNRVFRDLDRDLRISLSSEDLAIRSNITETSVLSDVVEPGRLAYVPLEVEMNGRAFKALFTVPFDVAIEIAREFYGV